MRNDGCVTVGAGAGGSEEPEPGGFLGEQSYALRLKLLCSRGWIRTLRRHPYLVSSHHLTFGAGGMVPGPAPKTQHNVSEAPVTEQPFLSFCNLT